MKIARVIEAERENEVNIKARNRRYSFMILLGTAGYMGYELTLRGLV